MTNRRTWMINGAVTFVAATLSLAVLEVGVRVVQRLHRVLPLVYYTTEDPAVTLWCYDEHLQSIPDFDLRTTTPYASIVYHGTEGKGPGLANLPYTEVPLAIEVRRNREGFREREFDDLPTDRPAWLVIGDSFCFGQGVRARDRMTEVLESRLAGAVTVVNLCRASADIEEIASILHDNLDRLPSRFPSARRVLYVYNLNDAVQTPKVRARQHYINDLMHLREYNVRELLPRAIRFAGRSAAVRWILYRLTAARVTRETERWYRLLYAPGDGWLRTQHVLLDMDRACRARGIELVVAIFPILHDLDDYPFRGVHRTLESFCRAHGIRCIDLLPALEGPRTETLWVHPTDFHPNHVAHRRVGEYLARELGLGEER